ncbi:hypothetical protein D3C78_1607100 [compost metagenome]
MQVSVHPTFHLRQAAFQRLAGTVCAEQLVGLDSLGVVQLFFHSSVEELPQCRNLAVLAFEGLHGVDADAVLRVVFEQVLGIVDHSGERFPAGFVQFAQHAVELAFNGVQLLVDIVQVLLAHG